MESSYQRRTDHAITLVIPRRPPPSMNTQERMHWAKRKQLRALYQHEVFVAWMDAGMPRFVRPRVTIRCYYKGNRIVRDRDNLYGGVGKMIDSLRGHAFSDDSMEVIDLVVEAEVDNRRERIEIEIEEVEE